MRRAGWMIAICLLFSAAARAQAPEGAGTPSGPGTETPPSENNRRMPAIFGAGEYDPWQVSVGAQYNYENLIGVPFETYGGNFSIVRYFGRWVGVETQVGGGFGPTRNGSNPPNLNARSLFGGIGPRLAYRNRSRIEPWAHLIVGAEYFHFYQSSKSQGSMTALAGLVGGGVDFYLWPHVAIRTEAEPVGSTFFSTKQRSFQAVAGVAFDF